MPSITTVTTFQRRFSLPLLLGLTIAGLAGNYFRFPIFLSIDFLFGSIFAMLALQFFGLGLGTLAAAAIASMTYALWNHPYAIIIMTAEVAVVGLLMTRRNMGMLLADALYWLLLGMPLVYLFYHGVMDVSPSSAFITMTKQAVNGVSNALLARLLFAAVSHQYRSGHVSLHELLGNLLTAFLLFPALILLAMGSRADFAEIDQTIRTSLLKNSQTLSGHLDRWVQDRTRAVVYLSELAATLEPAQMQPELAQTMATDGSFVRIGLRVALPDGRSVITAYVPPIDESGQSNIGKVFADRAYIATLRKTLQPVLSDIVPSRIDNTAPIAMLLAPVLRQGQYHGYVNSVLRLDQVRDILNLLTRGDTLRYTLLDQQGKVILSNRTDQTMMRPFERGQGVTKAVDAHVNQWLPLLPPNTTVSEQWKHSYYSVASPIGDPHGWQLLLEQPVAPFQKALYESYADKLALLFVILLGTLGLAELLSRRATAALERLNAVSRKLPQQLAVPDTQVDWPSSGILQISQLIDNFKTMSESLAQQFSAIRQLNATLEQRIHDRTADLAASEIRFRRLFESNSSVMLLIDPHSGQIEDANQAAADFYGYTRAQLTRLLIHNINTLSPERITQERQLAASQQRNYFLFQHRLASGVLRDVEVYSTPSEVNGRALLFSIVHDITERRRAQSALKQSEAKHRALVENSHDIIYTLDAQGVVTFISAS